MQRHPRAPRRATARRAGRLVAVATVLALLANLIVPAPVAAQNTAFPFQGVQFGEPLDRTTCEPNEPVSLLLDDPDLLRRTNWIRMDLIAAAPGLNGAHCVPHTGYRNILDRLARDAGHIQVIGLLTHDFVYGAGTTPNISQFATKAADIACHPWFQHVDVWQIWNEPNHPDTYLAPEVFGQLLVATTRAIRQRCATTARFITGGLNPVVYAPSEDGPATPDDYLRAVEQAIQDGGNPVGYQRLSDVVHGVGIHPYVDPYEGAAGHQPLADFMWAFRNYPSLYITEIGFPVGHEIDETRQCENLVRAYRVLRDHYAHQVRAAVWFTLRDFSVAPGERHGLYALEEDNRSRARPAYGGYLDGVCGAATGGYDAGADTLAWSPVPGASTYQVSVARQPQDTFSVVYSGAAPSVQLSSLATPLDAASSYRWKVSTVTGGQVRDSAEWEFVHQPAAPNARQVSAGHQHSCAVQLDKTAICWGNDPDGRATAPAGTFTQVSAGHNHSCGVRTDGTVTCWGSNSHGQASAPPGTFTQVSAGGYVIPVNVSTNLVGHHSCGVRTDGAVTCWGSDTYGQATAPAGSFTQVDIGERLTCGVRTTGTITCWGLDAGARTPTGGTFKQVSVAQRETCAVRTDGTIGCAGGNYHGQGRPPRGAFTEVTVGSTHTCGLRDTGTVACWGYQYQPGQALPPRGQFTQLSTDWSHTCGVRGDGTLVCWGDNPDGRATPPSSPLRQVAAANDTTCALRTDQTSTCWGGGTQGSGHQHLAAGAWRDISVGQGLVCGLRLDGSLGCGGASTHGQANPPEGTFTQVTAGGAFACALRADQTLACWGANHHGQSDPPAGAFVQVDAGFEHACAVRLDGRVTCWGRNSSGEANPGSYASATFQQVSAGWAHTCGVRVNGGVACWGATGTGHPPGGTFEQVSAGSQRSCGVRTDGTLACWTHHLQTPSVVPPAGDGFVQVAAGTGHICALRADGVAACAGSNSVGQANPPPVVQP